MVKRVIKKVSALILVFMLLIVLSLPALAAASVADSTYYNVGCLTVIEIAELSNLPIGEVIVMYPSNNEFYVGSSARQKIISGEVSIISIPGVGSSSVGAAAFAKHIATIKDEPVAGIVVGYGDITIYTEGTQGYYIGRPSNIAGIYYEEAASRTVVELYEAGARPDLLVSHSKGNMDMANALFKMYNDGNQSWYQGVSFKTFGCGVNVPPGLGSFNQYIGTLDSAGYLNTVSWSNMTYVYGRYHTTNPFYFATYLPIQYYL